MKKKVKIAYDYIRDNIKWNGKKTEYLSEEFYTNFKKKHLGNSADINLLLVALLNKAGLTSHAVVSSTRDHGYLLPFMVSQHKINYVVAGVELGEDFVLLDATDDNLVPGILPEYCLNGKGLVVNKLNEPVWVDLIGDNVAKTKNYSQIKQDENGEWIASIQTQKQNYDYLDWVKKHKKYDTQDEYAKYIESKFSKLNIKDYVLSFTRLFLFPLFLFRV